MLRNYIKTAFRSLLRHKGYSLLNILGLAIGMAAFILIYQFVRFESSYDEKLLSVDFLRLVGIAFLIAVPLAWVLMLPARP